MIFVILGSQKQQFNRLLEAIDKLIEEGVIQEEVFAQIGTSDYFPKYYPFEPFLDNTLFEEKMSSASIVITHGGTGSIVQAVKKNKKVIAVPRLKIYGEHVDDHQKQIVEAFDNLDYVVACHHIENLGKIYQSLPDQVFKSFQSSNKKVLADIENYIDRL